MEIKDVLKHTSIIGVAGNYQTNINLNVKVLDLNIDNVSNALKMVGLDDSYLSKVVKNLSESEQLKVELATKLASEIIIIGNLSNRLNHKDREYIKQLLVKLANNYNKKIVVIDNNITVFFNLVKKVYVLKNKEIIYEANDFFDDKLYEYVRMPKIIEFIKYVNKNEKRIDETIDIYELIKDIFRRVS